MKTLSITHKIELIDQKKFAVLPLGPIKKTFVIYIASLKAPKVAKTMIYPFWIKQIASLQANKALTKIFSKYLNYANGFLANFAIELLEHNDINDQAIGLINNK